MGYRVDYGPVKKVRGMEKKVCRVSALTGVFVLLFLMAVCAFWQEARDVLWALIFPGDRVAAIQAAEVFAQELKAGAPVKEAAEAFCITVLGDGFALH